MTSLGENIRANGIMLSPDEKTVDVTNGAVILAFDIRPDGAAANGGLQDAQSGRERRRPGD